jgi:predicted helicase
MTEIQHYLEKITQRYLTGKATEHSYRGDLQNLLESLLPDISITNEPTRINCGAPDYILSRGDLDIGWIEAKDIGKALDSKEYKQQFERYRTALDNLIITDYLQFDFYRAGQKVASISVGRVITRLTTKTIEPLPENFKAFHDLIKDFANYIGQSINSAAQLSKIMAAKARLLANIIENALNSDEENTANSSLKDQLQAFKNILLHEITASEFADIYAQTIAYGLFAARLHDDTPQTFSRQTAAEKIPLSNPFLRKLFQYIAGFDLDARIVWIVEALAAIFRIVNTEKVWNQTNRSSIALAIDESKKSKDFLLQDPIIHFYETFLAEYNPKLRKSRGVWYTPQAVVNFIIRAVDELLKTEFQLNGLADTSKTNITVDKPVLKGRGKTKYTIIEKQTKSVHKVQILDPATGTGTFLAETVKHIYQQEFSGMQGAWSDYVEKDLIPRLNGFEILMASYSMAHLKLDLLLTETGYKPKQQPRFNIYLTNSLEEHHPDTHSLFATWLSQEANEANHIKRDTPIMVVLGNPPYSVSSSNKGDWIRDLISDYKKDLNEKKINLDDDYIKFIRYGQHFIEKNGAGILAYISNNSFIDGVTHRQMRKHLLETFDRIYILDLHGSNKKKETAPDGSKDENVFDIMQGVSINIFVKTGKNNIRDNIPSRDVIPAVPVATVYHLDLYGLRKDKYAFLQNNSLASIDWQKLEYKKPYYFFVPKGFELEEEYQQGFSIPELFVEYNSGVQTKNDKLTIKFSDEEVISVIDAFKKYDENEIKTILKIKDSAGWKIKNAQEDIINNSGKLIDIQYRLFDIRKTYFTGKSSGFIGRTRGKVMTYMLSDNIAIIFKRTGKVYGQSYDFIFLSKTVISEGLFAIDCLGREYLAPLYLYPESSTQQTLDGNERKPNLNSELIKKISESLGLTFVAESNARVGIAHPTEFSPLDLLDYIYAVLHSPSYRETYKEFLKTDFPRVPYPSIETFWQLVKLGGELRTLHLLDWSPKQVLDSSIANYPIDGDNCITRKINKNDFVMINDEYGRVYINDSQYFDNVPLIAWQFYIGGYQPAQKWLKDRHGRQLSHDDIKHYRKMMVALVETDRIMQEIDAVLL